MPLLRHERGEATRTRPAGALKGEHVMSHARVTFVGLALLGLLTAALVAAQGTTVPVTVGTHAKKPKAKPMTVLADSSIWSATTYEAATAEEHRAILASGKRAVLTGEVVDVSCYLQLGKHGEAHAACATKCATNGQPIGLLDKQGGLTLLFPEEHHPRRDGQAEIRTVLIPLLAKTVTLHGTATTVHGAHALFLGAADLDSLRAANPAATPIGH